MVAADYRELRFVNIMMRLYEDVFQLDYVSLNHKEALFVHLTEKWLAKEAATSAKTGKMRGPRGDSASRREDFLQLIAERAVNGSSEVIEDMIAANAEWLILHLRHLPEAEQEKKLVLLKRVFLCYLDEIPAAEAAL